MRNVKVSAQTKKIEKVYKAAKLNFISEHVCQAILEDSK